MSRDRALEGDTQSEGKHVKDSCRHSRLKVWLQEHQSCVDKAFKHSPLGSEFVCLEKVNTDGGVLVIARVDGVSHR